MEITTIIGIVMAIVIMLIGLYLLLRGDPDTAALDQMLNLHADSQLPIIPRHLRARLVGNKRPAIPLESEQHGNQLAFDLDSSRSDNSHNNPTDCIDHIDGLSTATSTKATIPTPVTSIATPNSTANLNYSTSEHDRKQIDAHSHTEFNPAQALPAYSFDGAATVAATATKFTDDQNDQNVVNTAKFQLNPELETAALAQFEGESNLLDAHLNEQQRRDAEADISNADHVITLKVMANPRRALSGEKALKVMLKYGLRYGELSCFHRHEEPDQDSPLMFSVLRITDFGYAGFDLETLSTEQVQGLAFFMTFPHCKALTGFDTMSSIAHLIANEIEGRVFDETHREYNPQLKMYWRNHVIDYMAKHPR